MKEFNLEKYDESYWVNKGKGRKLGKLEKKVYEEFENFIERIKKGEIKESGHLKKEGGLKCFMDEKYNVAGVLLCPNQFKRGHKDIEFSIELNGLDDRYCWLTREWCGYGNGSYYIFDRKTKRVIFREDD